MAVNKQEVYQLLDQGQSEQAIAEQVGCRRQYISHLKKHRSETPRKRGRPFRTITKVKAKDHTEEGGNGHHLMSLEDVNRWAGEAQKALNEIGTLRNIKAALENENKILKEEKMKPLR